MKNVLAILALSSGIVSFPTFVMAEEDVAHYEAIHIETVDAAKKLLTDNVSEISKIVSKEADLEFLELENIHEISYSLEAAIDKIRAENGLPVSTSDLIDEAIQAIHFASENQEEEKTRTWFAKLETLVSNMDAAVVDAAPEKKEFYEIVIKDHKFSPEELIVPAGVKIKLIIKNQDPTPEEFESHDMNREKIIAGMGKATIFVGPLKPGKYHFFGEFNMDTANGYVIAK